MPPLTINEDLAPTKRVPPKSDESLAAYFWNPDHKIFYVDDLQVEIHSGDNPYEKYYGWRQNIFY